MKTSYSFGVISFIVNLVLGMVFIHGQVAFSRVIDDFNGATRIGWSDFTFQTGLGTIAQQNGRLQIDVPAIGQPLFAATTKTSEAFTLQDGRTLEFRVDLISGNDPDAYAGLTWMPTGKAISELTGYSMVKSSSDVIIAKGVEKYFVDFTGPVKNDNVTLVLSITAKGANVILNGKVLDKDNNNAVIFDKTYIDTPAADVFATGTDSSAAPFLGSGNVALLGYANNTKQKVDPNFAYTVVFDNLKAFVLDNAVIDNFSGATRTGWTDFTFQPGLGAFTQTAGQLKIEVPAVGQPLFAATIRTSPTYTVADGQRLELRVDVVSGNDVDSYAGISWLPVGKLISDLAGYSMVMSSSDTILAKGVNKYFIDYTATALKNNNVTLVLSIEGDGSNVIINGKVLDKDNNNAVIFDKTYVDTPSADVLGTGTDSPAAPYMGAGNYMLLCYANNTKQRVDPNFNYTVEFANAAISAPPAISGTPPVISDVKPLQYANFLPASSNVSFTVTDDKALGNDKISVTLNGVIYTSTNGLVITGTGNSRNATLGGLKANVNYSGLIQATDSDTNSVSAALAFDTFNEAALTVEVEDYNFDGGRFIDNPIVIPEGFWQQDGAYHFVTGVADTDYHDSKAYTKYNVYRPYDGAASKRSLDFVRKIFADAGGAANDFYDYDIGEIATGDWMNYTRTFTTGFYEVYLRQLLFNDDHSEAALELVTSDASVPDQTTRVLGSFLGVSSGTKYRNIPLTDGTGQNKVVVQLSGRQTLRLREVTADPTDGNIYQNYMVFIPTTNSGPQRATVSAITPVANSVVETVAPVINISIQNRDTAVKSGSINLQFNGRTVSPVLSNTVNGVNVSYVISPLPPSNSTNIVNVAFQDEQNVTLTYQWSFVVSYKSLDPLSRRDGPGLSSGFNLHFVQAPAGTNLENTLERAESQLAPHSTIPAFINTNLTAPVINFTIKDPPAFDGYFDGDLLVPGLQPADNGTLDFAMEMLTWLQLSAGVHKFGVQCDDSYRIASGVDYLSPNAPPLAFHNDGPADETFDFVVPQDGFYPFRMVWEQRGGGAHVEWFSVDPATGVKTLINDPNPTAVKAYQSVAAPMILLFSSDKVTGAFAIESSAALDSGAKTITITRNGNTRFYRLKGTNALTINSIVIQNEKVVLKYK